MKYRFNFTLFAVVICLPPLSVAADNYGAIAYDMDTNGYGVTWDNPSQEIANQIALSRCAEKGPNCEVVVRFVNSCGAFATGPNKTNGYGWGGSEEQARKAAEFYCDSNASGMCRPRVSGCNTFYNEPSIIVDGPKEVIDPGAAARNRSWAEDARRWGGQQEYDRICQNSPGGCQ